MNVQFRLLSVAIFVTSGLVIAAAQRQVVSPDTPKRILLFIGDGMGDSEITLARNYSVGAGGRLAMDDLPFTGAYTTYSVQEAAPNLPNYVPDSAATGTAWATGQKTSNGRISTSPASDHDLLTILELARAQGWRTGNVTTAELTDATPAVLASHVANRSCQGPMDMALCPQDTVAAGGAGSIAEQMIAHEVDVLLGGGAARFAQTTSRGSLVLDDAIARGDRVVTTAATLRSLRPGTRVIGLFAPGNLPVEWKGIDARPYPSNVDAPQRCIEDQRPADVPSLADMTTAALAHLDRGDNRGFFLQVEGASIDKQDHLADPCGQIGETVAFDRAVKIGMDYARSHPDTLLIVSADHAHTSQIVGAQTDESHSLGLISALRTNEGGVLNVSYATNSYHHSQDHTGTQVRVAAMGPGGQRVVGRIDQTDLFRIMASAFDRER